MIENIKTYSLADLYIKPAPISYIGSRKECNPYYAGKLPIFAAPMSCVVSEDNWYEFKKHAVIPIAPRSTSVEFRKKVYKEGSWVAVGLSEWDEFVDIAVNDEFTHYHLLLDVANGHMQTVQAAIVSARQKINSTGLEIMVGNIANPESYRILSNAGADYIRCGIGGGQQCITSTQCRIHYPAGTLIDKCAFVRKEMSYEGLTGAKIVCDGGIRSYGDAITALALGADYVMIGSLIGSMWESSADFYVEDETGNRNSLKALDAVIELREHQDYDKFKKDYPYCTLKKILYGMASRVAQKEIAKASGGLYLKKTSEGKVSEVECKGHIEQWLDNFTDYLKSAMSYTNCLTLQSFTRNVTLVPCSESERERINK